MSNTIKGYKVTDKDMQCRGYQYEIGRKFIHSGELEVCGSGFHFCLQAANCFNYYQFSSENRVFEIEASGHILTEGDKSAASEITFIRELPWEEVLKLVNTGSDNTGVGNSGDSNSGDRNSGNRNSGDRNSGNRNSGNRNSGYSNSGDRNSGDRNSGNWNSGNRNSGYSNSGDSNSGNWNSGNRNSGYSNSGDRNSGLFCTGDAPFPIFNKPSDWTEQDFLNSRAYSLLCQVDTKQWIPTSHMTEEEKKKYPSHATNEGYLKDIPFKEAFQNSWHNWSESNRKAFMELPNFDKDVFFEITGVKI